MEEDEESVKPVDDEFEDFEDAEEDIRDVVVPGEILTEDVKNYLEYIINVNESEDGSSTMKIE